MLTSILTALALGYIIGSIPFGLVITRVAGLGDIRKIGSGNIGATNVLRTGRKDLALATLVLDGGKGAIAVAIAWLLLPKDAYVYAGLGAVIGHSYPVWLGFKGGKGVATTLGTMLAMHPWLGLVACAVWLIMAGLFRISSLAALTALGIISLIALWHEPFSHAVVVMALAGIVFLRHKDNINRLMHGTEPKIGAKKSDGNGEQQPA